MNQQSPYAGMSVNERLFDAGLLDAFNAAARARDRAEMIRLLASVDLEDAAGSVDMILETPARYGY